MKEYLPAIDQLIEHYSNQEPLSQLALGLEGCPLCKIGRLPESSVPTDDNCPSCPWVVLEGGIVAPVAHTITVAVSHFTPFAVIATLPPEEEVTPPEEEVIPPEEEVIPPEEEEVLPEEEEVLPEEEEVLPEEEEAVAPIHWGFIVGIIAAVIVIGVAILLLIRRRRAR